MTCLLCDLPVQAVGYCKSHYMSQVWKKGLVQRPTRRSADTVEEALFLASCGDRLLTIACRLYPEANDPMDSLYQAFRRAHRNQNWLTLKEAS